MSERVVEIDSSKADQTVDKIFRSEPMADIQEITIDDLKHFDFESFVSQNREEFNKVLNQLQTENSLPSIDVQTSGIDYPILDHLSDYLTSDDEDFGNNLISDVNHQTTGHCSQTYSSSQSMSSTKPLTATQETIGQPLISANVCSHRSEDTFLSKQFDFDSDVFETSLVLESKPIKITHLVSKSYQKKRSNLLKGVRRLYFKPSHGLFNVWFIVLKCITDVWPSLTGLIKMGKHSVRKTGVKGSTTGPYVHRLTVLTGVITITIENESFVLKRDQLIKIRKHLHYFITNSESKESLIYFKVSSD